MKRALGIIILSIIVAVATFGFGAYLATTKTEATDTITGIASNYHGTAGFIGQATVALPGPLGGRYTGRINGYATVCANRCAVLPIVDWCDCYWGSSDQRVADLSQEAWALITNKPASAGLMRVTVTIGGHIRPNRNLPSNPESLPDTAME